MSVVIHIIDNAAGLPCPFAGEYILDFDPHFGGTKDRGRGFLVTTADPLHAKQFSDIVEALDFWKQQSPTVPLRDDNEPNRPLTAFTVEIETAPGSALQHEEEVRVTI